MGTHRTGSFYLIIQIEAPINHKAAYMTIFKVAKNCLQQPEVGFEHPYSKCDYWSILIPAFGQWNFKTGEVQLIGNQTF